MNENTIIPLIFKSNNNRFFFEFLINSNSASIEYQFVNKNKLILLRTKVSKYLGEDVGPALIERVFDHALRMDYEIVPKCPLIMRYLKANRRFLKLVANDFAVQ